MNVRVLTIAIVLGAAAVGLVACWPSEAPALAHGSRSDPEAGVPVSTAEPALASAGGAGLESGAGPARAVRARSSGVARPLHREFEQVADLYAFRRRLQPLVEAGDANARWLSSRVDEYCAGFARDPAGFARDSDLISGMQLSAARRLSMARDRIGSRCSRFVPDDAPTFVQLVKQRQDAAQAGSLAAEAALLAMGAPLHDDMEYRRDLVRRVQTSRDPDAFSALSPAMGVTASGDPALVDTISGTQASEFAWTTAACDLGLDCSGDGALMTQYCVNGGVCARDARQDFSSFIRDAAVPPQGVEEIDRMKNALMEDAPVSPQLLGKVTR